MLNLFRTWLGVARSIRIYRMDPAHARAMDALYARFVRPGDLVFDIGAHVGDRVASFRRLGARVVALEPQQAPATVIRLLHALDKHVTVLQLACGAAEGDVDLIVNSRNPTVSTASRDFVAAADGAAGWSDQVWDRAVRIPMTTLDALIARYGRPAFVKIDVEGFEDQVLQGLSSPVPALSFEFTTLQREVARRCLARIAELGPYRFNFALGETQTLVWPEFRPGAEVLAYLDQLPAEANSGDVYALLEG